MGFEFLVRVRHVTLILTALAALAGAVYAGLPAGLAVALGSLWSVANLLVLEAVARLILAAALGRAPAGGDLVRVLAGGPALFAGGWALLASGLPLTALTLGFAILFAVVVLKGVGVALAQALDFATGRGPEPPSAAVRRPLPPRRAQGLVGWAIVLALGGALALWAFAQPSPAPAGAPAAAPASENAAAAEHHAESAGASEAEDSGNPELPTATGVLAKLFPGTPLARALTEWENLIFSLLATAILVVLVRLAFARPQLVPGRGQALVELIAGGARDFVVETFGPHMERYVPFVGTIFFYILTMNWMGLVPLLKSPTTSLNTTAAMAVVVFLYVQYTAIRYQGFFGYLYHLAGSPQGAIGWVMAPVLFPVEVMGEFIKPLSLAARLFGNIFGEDLLIAVFVGIGVTILAWQPVPVGFPIHVLFVFLGLVMSAVQALVFALLACVYLYMSLPHGDEEEHHGAAAGAQPAHA
jgi:F-type H+-transporting ATPase subunit a